MEINEIQLLNSQIISKEESVNLPNPPTEFQSNQQDTYERLNQLFTDQDKQKKEVQEARDILGESTKDLSDSQVYDLVNEVQFLVDSWLEEYEQSVFDGKTLNELMGEQK